MENARVACRTPAKDRDGVTNIPEWKFEVIRKHIHDVLADGATRASDLPDLVRARLNADQLDRLGSVGWHVTTVKLELEVRGEIERIAAKGPQQVRLKR